MLTHSRMRPHDDDDDDDDGKLKLTMKANQVKCWFLRRGETGVPGEKPLGAE